MDVSAVSAVDARSYSDAATSDRSARASTQGTSRAETPKFEAAVKAVKTEDKPKPPPVSDSPRIKVQIQQRPSGSEHTTIVDTRTGLPLLELPPEHVVQVVEGILWRQRHAKDKDPQQEPAPKDIA